MVVAAPGHPTQRVGGGDQAPDAVVLQAGDPTQRVGHSHHLPGRVIGEAAVPVPGVLDPAHAPAPVVAHTAGPGPGLHPAHGPAGTVIGGGDPLPRGPHLAHDPPVGVVDDLVTGPARGHGGAPAPAPVVLVTVDVTGGQGHRQDAAGTVMGVAGGGAPGVGDLHHPTAAVVAQERPGTGGVGAGGLASQGVVRGRPGGLRVAEGHRPAVGPALDGPLRAHGVHRGADPAHLVVLQAPGAALRVRDGSQPREGVVGEVPGAPVRQPHACQVAQVVDLAGQGTAQLVGDRLLLAVIPVGDLRAPAHRVHPGQEASTTAVLETPDRAVGVRASHAHPGVVIVVGGSVAHGCDGVRHPPRLVTHQTGPPTGTVGHGHQVPVDVVVQVHTHPGGVHQACEHATGPGQLGPPALGIDDEGRVTRVALVPVPGHAPVAAVPPLRRTLVGAVLALPPVAVLALRRTLVVAFLRVLLPGSTDADLDETVLIVPHAGGPGPAGQLLHGQAPTVVEEPDRAGAVPRDHHDLVAPTVPAHPLLGAMGVHHTDQAAAAVMDPGVGAPTVLVRHHGDHARQVGVGRDPAGGRTLCGDPAGVVVGVVHLHHAVTIHHPADQPVLVPLVAAPRARPGDLDQLPLAVVGEGQAAPVRGLRRGDPPGVLVPDQLDAAATLVDQADQAPVAVLVVHRGPRAAGLTQEHAGGAERPAAAGVVRGHQGLAGGTAAPLQPQALAHGTVPALPHAGEDRDPTVRVHPTGAVLIQVQARVRRTGPPRPEPTGLAGGGVVHADQCQRGAASGEGQVHLRLDEVPGGGVDRVVGVAVGEGTSLDGRQVDGDLGTLRGHAGRVQGRLDGGVREGGDTAGTARSLEGAGHGVRPGGVLVIVGQVGVIGGEHASRLHGPPCAGGLERGVARPQRGGLVAQLVVLGPAGGRE